MQVNGQFQKTMNASRHGGDTHEGGISSTKGPETHLGFRAQYYNINGIWALKPCYLGPWTLMVP